MVGKTRGWGVLLGEWKLVRASAFLGSLARMASALKIKCPTLLRTFAPIATAHRYGACKFTRHIMHQVLALRNKKTMIGKMTIVTALPGCYDLRHFVTPTFLFRNRFYLQWSTHCPKMNKNWAWEVKKNSRFLSTGHRILPSCDWNSSIFTKDNVNIHHFYRRWGEELF